MARSEEWIPQSFITDYHQIFLGPEHVEIAAFSNAPGGEVMVTIYPVSRKNANQLSIALKKAARRLEEIGKELD